MENQKSNAKMYVAFFAVSIILFATAAMIGLSINVSKDHLKAVTSAGEAIHRSCVNTEEMVYQEYAQLSGMQDTAFNPDVKQLRDLSSDLIHYIQFMRYDLIQYVDGQQAAADNAHAFMGGVPYISASAIMNKDNVDAQMQFMLGRQPTSRATELKNKINEYKLAVLQLVPAEKRNVVEQKLDFLSTANVYDRRNERDESWEEFMFQYTIASAAAMELETLSLDIQSAGLIILKNL
ncbi:MAG: hypothetical protein PUF10_06885 [Bacteroidales bacterium]|nr:hypothetical protein [Bacteroidales bacterium]